VIHDVFDNDPEKIGRTVGNIVVKHIDELKKSVAEADEIIGIVATPSSSAQAVSELMVDAGIRVILNYTDVLLHVPYSVDVHRIDPTAQLMHTLYYLTRLAGKQPRKKVTGFGLRPPANAGGRFLRVGASDKKGPSEGPQDTARFLRLFSRWRCRQR
jgi:hypothetical protein